MTDQKSAPLERDPHEPFALQLEWLRNRYNPGYFLGGTIRPDLDKASLGPNAKRVAGALTFFLGATTLIFPALLLAAKVPPDPWSLGFGLLSVLAGFKLWEAAGLQAPEAGNGGRSAGRWALQAVLMMALGVPVTAAVGVVAVTVVAVVATGHAGLTAAIAVVIAVVAVKRATRRSPGEPPADE